MQAEKTPDGAAFRNQRQVQLVRTSGGIYRTPPCRCMSAHGTLVCAHGTFAAFSGPGLYLDLPGRSAEYVPFHHSRYCGYLQLPVGEPYIIIILTFVYLRLPVER